jgi:hypothetical protein
MLQMSGLFGFENVWLLVVAVMGVSTVVVGLVWMELRSLNQEMAYYQHLGLSDDELSRPIDGSGGYPSDTSQELESLLQSFEDCFHQLSERLNNLPSQSPQQPADRLNWNDVFHQNAWSPQGYSQSPSDWSTDSQSESQKVPEENDPEMADQEYLDRLFRELFGSEEPWPSQEEIVRLNVFQALNQHLFEHPFSVSRFTPEKN